jgi:hypothetical protein
MRDLSYVEGRDFDIVYRFADGYAERLSKPVRESSGESRLNVKIGCPDPVPARTGR